MNIAIKLPIVLAENLIFSMFPRSRDIVEKYLFNPYAFNEKHARYSLDQFEDFCQKIGGVSNILDKNILELGPGGSIGFGLLCIKNGAKKYYAIDNGTHAFISKKQMKSYRKLLDNDTELIKQLFVQREEKYCYNDSKIKFIEIDQKSKYSLPDNSVDFIYSCAVLEHVHDLDLCFLEMTRVLKTGGTMNHQVDLRDHIFFQNSLWFLKIKEYWFKKFFEKTGEYVNRKRVSYYLELIKKNGLKLIDLKKVIVFNGIIPENLKVAYGEDDLKTLSINILIKK